MRLPILILLLALPLSAEKVAFDENDRFSVDFPDNWKKAKPPQDNIVVHRETEDGEAAFSISLLGVAKGRQADLDGTLDTFIKNFSRAGMTVKGKPKGQPSMIDGKKALVATVPVEITLEGQVTSITFFLVVLEAKERVIIMQATLPGKGTNEQRKQCLKIIGSFKEHYVEEEEDKPEDESEKKSGDPSDE